VKEKLSDNARRVILATTLLLVLPNLINLYWKLRWFGDYDLLVFAGVMFLYTIVAKYFLPATGLLTIWREKRQREQGAQK